MLCMSMGTLGPLLLAWAVPGAGHTRKAVPGAAALPRGGKEVSQPDPPVSLRALEGRRGAVLHVSWLLPLPFLVFFFFSCLTG